MVAAVGELHAGSADGGAEGSDAAGSRGSVSSPNSWTASRRTRNQRDTFTPAELQKVLKHIDGDRYAIAWQHPLTGLRRGDHGWRSR